MALWWAHTSSGQRLIDSRGTGTTGNIAGFQIKNYNSSTGDYCMVDNGAGHYINLAQNSYPLSFNPCDGNWHLFVACWDDSTKTLDFFWTATSSTA